MCLIRKMGFLHTQTEDLRIKRFRRLYGRTSSLWGGNGPGITGITGEKRHKKNSGRADALPLWDADGKTYTENSRSLYTGKGQYALAVTVSSLSADSRAERIRGRMVSWL